MAVEITPEMHKSFTSNGFSEDDIQNTVNHYRESGQSDKEISSRLEMKHKEFSTENILNNDALTGQQKADKIQQMGEAERAGYDKDLNAYKLKATAGAGLAIGGQALDFVPVVGPAIAGAAYGAGDAMIHDKSNADIAKDAAIVGATTYGLSKVAPLIAKSPVGKFVGEKIGQPIADAVSPVFNKIGQGIENKFGVNLGEELTKPRLMPKLIKDPVIDLTSVNPETQAIVDSNLARMAANQADNIPTVGEAPIQQTSPSSFAIEADKTLPREMPIFGQERKFTEVPEPKAAIDKELRNEAYNVYSQATGKNKKYIQMQGKNNEKLELALDGTSDKLDGDVDGLRAKHFGGNANENGYNTAEYALNKIQKNDWETPGSKVDRHDYEFGKELEEEYNKHKSNVAGIINNEKDIDLASEKALDYIEANMPKELQDDLTREVLEHHERSYDTQKFNSRMQGQGTQRENGTSYSANNGNYENIKNESPSNSNEQSPSRLNTSKFAQTVKGSGLATEDLKNNINDIGYQAITNKDTLANAQQTINKGQVEAINQVLTSDKPNANEIAMAHDLVRRLQQQGDVETAVKIVEDTSRKLTKAGQTIQAAKMWQQLTPDGALLSYQRAINENVPEHVKPFLDNAKQLTKQLQGAKTQQEAAQIVRENMRGLAPNAKTKIINQIKQARETGTINEETLTNAIKSHYKIKTIGQADVDEINALTSQIAKATTDRDKEVATALLQRKISEVKPVTLGRKLSTTQAMAQLLNPKTVIRNVAGNSMYGGLENATQSLVAAPLDNIVSKFTGERTVLPNNLKTQYQGLIDGAKQGAQDVRLGIDTAQNKYDLPSGRTFRSGIGEKAEKLMNYTLRVPDRAAYQAVYEEALQNQMKARGLKEPTEEIINQAKEEALKRTFQDDSALAKLFQGTKKGLNFNKEFGLGDFVLKYAKTPANILSRGLSYSPVGLAKGVGELTLPSKIQSMPFNQRKAVMDIARGLTGTGIMGTGYGLSKSGLVTGQKDDNLRMNANLMAMGERPYSVKIGDKNYTYDWAVPASMPFSAGVNYNNGADFLGSLASSMDTLTEQPLLQGVKKLSGGGYKTPAEGLVDVAADSLNSFYPSMLRQTAQTVDPYYRETRDNNVFKQALNRTISNTPMLSETLPKKIEVTGQPIKREGGIAQNFFNPASVSSVKNNAGLSEAIRLEKPYLSVGKKLKIGDGMKQLTPKEMSDYQQKVGLFTDAYVNQLVNSEQYQLADDEEKANMIGQLEKDINKQAKHELFGTSGLLDKKARTREQIIKSKLAKYNRVQNLIRKANITQSMSE